MAIDDIPKEMERLGFKLISSTEGGKALIAPTLEGLVYYPNKQSKAGVGEFTSIDFDDETQTALIRTSDGEEGFVRVDVDNDTVHYRAVADGRESKKTLTYEGNLKVIKWVNEHANVEHVPASMKYDGQTSRLTVEKEGVGEIYRELVQLPEGTKLETILRGRILKISDTRGGEFTITGDPMSGQGYRKSKHVVLSLDPDAVEEDRVGFISMLDGHISYCDNIPGLIDDLMGSVYHDELYGREQPPSSVIDVADKPLNVIGPNRRGDYRLTSGKSSITYNPETGEVSLGNGWNPQGYVNGKIVGGSVQEGSLTVREDFSEGVSGGHKIWKVSINFGNQDPAKSYTATLVENTARDL